jgi:hypothetical protein
MLKLKLALFAALLSTLVDVIHGSLIGLNAGAQFDSSMVAYVAESGAKLVRLNFIVTDDHYGPGKLIIDLSSKRCLLDYFVDDPNFIAMYDDIINSYLNQGIAVYGLIGAESVKSGKYTPAEGVFR